ncbi:MAG: hypothetical protein WHV44_03645 [Anaerolineales bacterium]
MATPTAIYDPWAEVNNPPELQYDNHLWGQVEINAWTCALVKGIGKVAWDEQAHGAQNRHTAIDITIHALPEMDIQNENITKRETLAWAKDWKTIILPSIKDLGFMDVRELNGKWVKVESVPTGKTYQKNGETYNKTTFRFERVFVNEAECRADYLTQSGEPGAESAADYPPAPKKSAEQILGELGFDNPEKKAAEQFLYFALENATRGKQDAEAWAAVPGAIAMYPQVAKYFSHESPEVKAWMDKKGFIQF